MKKPSKLCKNCKHALSLRGEWICTVDVKNTDIEYSPVTGQGLIKPFGIIYSCKRRRMSDCGPEARFFKSIGILKRIKNKLWAGS